MTWAERRLDELGTVSRGRSRHRPRDAVHLYGGPYPFFQTGDIKRADLYLTEHSQTYSEAGLEQSKLWPNGTLCITIAANIAETAILGIDACFPDSVIGFVADEKQCDVRFIKYKFDTIKRHYQQVSHGAAQDNLSQEKLISFTLSVPNVETQTRIADILSSYDDLIENNRRRMALLEEAARHLYEEWFVRLRFPGHEHVRIIDGLPEGWEHRELGSLIDVIHGFAFQGGYFSDAETSRVLVTPGNFAIGGGFKMDKLKFYNEDAPLDSKYVLEPSDLILTMTDLSKESDTLGFPGMVPVIDGLQFLHNQRIGRVVPKSDFFPKHFLYNVFTDDRYRHHVVASSTGTSVKHTSPGRILSYSAAMPKSRALVEAFDRLTLPFYQQHNCLFATNCKLAAARDLMLPRLMSGEIAV